MAHKCFISYKKEDLEYRDHLLKIFRSTEVINKSLDRTINSDNGDYVMQVIRDDYLKDSTVTIFLIGEHSSENEGTDWQGDKNYFIKRELQASLYNGTGNTRSGILGVVLPNMYDAIYRGTYTCSECGGTHTWVALSDGTVIREFRVNYYMEPHIGCAWTEDDRYCVLVKWDEFLDNMEYYIECAFQKRTSDAAKKVKIRGLR